MYGGLLGILQDISGVLCWIAPFTFVFCLIYAIKEAVSGGKHDITLASVSAVSLFIIMAAVLLN